MLTSSGIKMAGIPSPTPGSAEGTENEDDQSKIPPSGHTPGSAEGEDVPEPSSDFDRKNNRAGHLT
jgi:hypothetical protein